MMRNNHNGNGNGNGCLGRERPERNGASRVAHYLAPSVVPRKEPVLITGGAGFIGTNLADRLLAAGQRVILYDNLARPGVEQNWRWLQRTHGDLVDLEEEDVRHFRALCAATRSASQVFHFAAQVAVTTSLLDPIEDFEINARGTLNLLESLRRLAGRAKEPPSLLFTSTNKVYGDLSDVRLRIGANRYEPESAPLRQHGFNEARPLNFHSPYGCSKGAACQYVLDYARTFRLPALAFRMSCIYGPHQFGTEDQGWVAHFLICALEGSPVTIYGDGRQVRDILYVEDLIDAFLLAQQNMAALAGEAFNIGGGSANTISLIELLALISELHGQPPQTVFEDWRPADQMYYVSDIRRFSNATQWRPRTAVSDGVRRLYEWLKETRRTGPRAEATNHRSVAAALLSSRLSAAHRKGTNGRRASRLRRSRRATRFCPPQGGIGVRASGKP